MCVLVNYAIPDSYNDKVIKRQAIIWTDAWLSLMRFLETDFSEILMKLQLSNDDIKYLHNGSDFDWNWKYRMHQKYDT